MAPTTTKRQLDGSSKSEKRRKLTSETDGIEDQTDGEINMIIANLSVPDNKIQVVVNHANHTSNMEVQAYAKLAGATWTYYVQTLTVSIGRTSSPDESDVQIDLSPSKVVSRSHCQIQYNLDGRFWEMAIFGRNGVRIDKVAHKNGTVRLYSGNVLDIGGLQMMFVLPDVPPKVAPAVRNAIMNKPISSLSTNGDKKHTGYQGWPNSTSDEHSAPLTSLATAAAVASLNGAMFDGQKLGGKKAAGSSMPYPKGVAIITRPQVRGVNQGAQYIFDQDLSSDDAKDIKPPYSYATMITQAIMSTPDMMMSLADIYDWIASRYSFYRHSTSGWQNSIRHNLSLNKAFEKVPRKAHEPGKGMKWQITPQFKEEFIRKASCGRLIKGRTSTLQQRLRDSPMKQQQKQYEHVLRPGKRTSPTKLNEFEGSTVAEDTDDDDALGHGEGLNGNIPKLGYATPKKGSENYDQRYTDAFGLVGSPSPPNSRYLAVSQLEAYTPDRGSYRTNTGNNNGNVSPMEKANVSETKAENAKESTANGKSANKATDTTTPAPAPRLQLAPPSTTQQLPSSFMPGSSPAPFWKLMQLSSTPVRGGEASPIKYTGTPERHADGSDDVLGDLHDVDLTRGFRSWRGDSSTGERTPEQLKPVS